MPRDQSVVAVVPGSPEPDVLCCQALCSGKGMGNACMPSLACLSEDQHRDGVGGEGPGMFNVLDIHLVQHCPGPGSYCKLDLALAKDFHWAWRWCWGCCAGARFLGRLRQRKKSRRGMCSTATNMLLWRQGLRLQSRHPAKSVKLSEIQSHKERKQVSCQKWERNNEPTVLDHPQTTLLHRSVISPVTSLKWVKKVNV